MVLIPKGVRHSGRIGLVDVLWNMIEKIMNRRLGLAIILHDALHKFLASCRSGNASLKSMILQHLTFMRE